MEKYAGHATLELKTSYLIAGAPGDYLAKGQVQRISSPSLLQMRPFIVIMNWLAMQRYIYSAPTKN